MRILKHILLLSALSLALFSCKEETVNEIYDEPVPENFTAKISEGSFQMIKVHPTYYDPDYVAANGEYNIGLRITLKLNDPSQKDKVNCLMLVYKSKTYNFDREELEKAYIDTLGGYSLDLLSFDRVNDYSPMVWKITLYDASYNSSEEFSLTTKFTDPIISYLCNNYWMSGNIWEVSLNAGVTAEGFKVETHFINSDNEEISAVENLVENSRWNISEVPEEAAKFYYVLKNEYDGVNRTFISNRFPIADRISAGPEFIDDVKNPLQIEYLRDLDKILVLTSGELMLINYDDNSIVWKRQTSSASCFAYSAERQTIYLGYSIGGVDSLNPATGEGGKLFELYPSVYRILPFGKYIMAFPEFEASISVCFDLDARAILDGENLYCRNLSGAVYNPYNGRVIVHTSGLVESYEIDRLIFNEVRFKVNAFKEIDNSGGRYDLILSPDGKRVFAGEGKIFSCADSAGKDLAVEESIAPFGHLTLFSGNYIASITSGSYYSEKSSSLSIYNPDLTLIKKKVGLAGAAKKIFSKDNTLKIYSVYMDGRLIVQKFAVNEMMKSSVKKINHGKVYKMIKL